MKIPSHREQRPAPKARGDRQREADAESGKKQAVPVEADKDSKA